jgi:hypothetical protein
VDTVAHLVLVASIVTSGGVEHYHVLPGGIIGARIFIQALWVAAKQTWHEGGLNMLGTKVRCVHERTGSVLNGQIIEGLLYISYDSSCVRAYELKDTYVLTEFGYFYITKPLEEA